MAKSEKELRARIIDAAGQLFAEYGFTGTRVRMVAKASGVSSGTIRRLIGDRTDIFEQVLLSRTVPTAAQRVAAAVQDPDQAPPLSVLLTLANEVFASPDVGWDGLELQGLTGAHLHDRLRAVELERTGYRWQNMKALLGQVRAHGGLDAGVSDRALAYLFLSLTAGMALLDPVVEDKPATAEWIGLIARVAQAVAPQDIFLEPDYQARQPWWLRVDISEQPGSVARIVRALSTLHLYVISVQIVGHEDGVRTIDIGMTAPAGVTEDAIRAVALSAGQRVYLVHGTPQDALDLPTRVLDGAAKLVRTPELAPLTAAELVGAEAVEVTGANEGEDDSPDVLRLQWTPEQHVVLQRSWAPFARAERARASALLRLSAEISAATGDEDAVGWVEPIKGGTVWVRLARPEDADAVAAMHDRCSERSRYQRYFAITEWHGTKLYRLAGGHRGATLVVMSEEGQIVGLGNVFPDSSEGSHVAEVALIIEDAYQGRGVGKILLKDLLHMATRLGFEEVVASVLAENRAMLHLFARTGLDWHTTVDKSIAYMRAPLPATIEPVLAEGQVRRTIRRPAVKKAAPARKAATKKAAPAKKAAVKKAAPARKAATKKAAPAKKAAAKKAAPAKKAATKKAAPAKKAAVKKAAVKKAAVQKAAPAKKAATAKAPVKRAAAKKAPSVPEQPS